MSTPAAITAAARAALLARERAHADDLVRLYGAAYQRIQARLGDLLARADAARRAGEEVSASWLHQEARYSLLLTQVQAETDAFGGQAGTLIAGQQAAAVQQAVRDAPALLSASLPAEISGSFATLPAPAARQLVGSLGDGQPLASLLSQIAPLAAQGAAAALVTGLVAGDSTRTVAGAMRQELGIGLTRALTISRTSVITSYRDASLEIYRANDDVVSEWRWESSHSARTCAMCLAMDGQTFPLDTPFGSHPNCRCVPVPVTVSWADLGFQGLDGPPASRETGAAWFARQPEDVQRQILGPAKLAAYKAGNITLQDIVAYRDDPRWGPTRYERSLRGVSANPISANPRPVSGTSAAAPVPPPALPMPPGPPAPPPVPPGPPPASTPPPPGNPDWLAEVRAARLPEMRGYAGLRELELTEYEAQVNTHLARLMKDLRPWLRIRSDRLEQVLQDGRFKNRFETNTSGGTLNIQARIRTEAAHFGLPENAAATERPIYGFLHLGGRRATGPEALSSTQYGEVAVRLKPEVMARTTFTGGDSMDETLAGFSPTLAAMPANSPKWEAMSSELRDLLKYPSAPTLLRNVDARVGFLEAQYHDGLTLSDIAEVIFDERPSPALIRLFRTNKVRWRVLR